MTSTSLGKDYILVEKEGEDTFGIKLLCDEYKGIIYQYGKVALIEDEMRVDFERTFRYVPVEFDLEEIEYDEDLQNLMGDILVELIDKQVKGEI